MNFNTFFNNDYTPKWDYIETIPEFAALKVCLHSLRFHSEGDPWEHTKLVVDNAALILKNPKFDDVWVTYSNWRKEALLLAALFHDIGKPAVTSWNEKEGDWSAPDHAEKGAKMTRMILACGGFEDIQQRELVVALVRCPMRMHELLHHPEKIQRRLCEYALFDYKNDFFHATFDDARFMAFCDSLGTWSKRKPMAERLRIYNELKALRTNYLVAPTLNFNFRGKIDAYKIVRSEENLTFDEDFTVYVAIGVSGSGKTSYMKKNYPDLPILSRDIARAELGFCEPGKKFVGNVDQENKVTSYLEKKMKKYASEHKDFIIDDMNIRQKYRESIHRTLAGTNARYVYIYVEAPTMQDAINRRRADFGDRTEQLIKDMYSSIEFPYPHEYLYTIKFVISRDEPNNPLFNHV